MILIDTCVLTRLADSASLEFPVARKAYAQLLHHEPMCIVPQNIYEFWAVATRARGTIASGGQNGLGMEPESAIWWIRHFQRTCHVLPDRIDALKTWEAMVVQYRVKGFQAHDLKFVAAMQVHGVSRILTFNLKHFKNYPITVVDPASL